MGVYASQKEGLDEFVENLVGSCPQSQRAMCG